MSQPLITIGMTCFNAADTIGRAIEGALSQDWENKEIIMVDDCSQDGSLEIIQSLLKDIPYAKIVRHDKNQGFANALNTIIEHSSGEFLAIFDDDDKSLPPRLKTQYERIKSYEEETGEKLIACYASGFRFYPNGYKCSLNPIGSYSPIPHGEDVANQYLYFGGSSKYYFGGTPACSLMARISTLKALGGFDPFFRRKQDMDFGVRLAMAGGHFIGCPEELLHQYASGGADKNPDIGLKCALQLAEKHKDYLVSKGKYYYAKNWPKIRYHYFKGAYFKMLWVLLKVWAHYPLQVPTHFFKTGPARLVHDLKIKRQTP